MTQPMTTQHTLRPRLRPRAKCFLTLTVLLVGAPLFLSTQSPSLAAEPAEEASDLAAGNPATVAEARGRARLLYETIRGSLQIVHRDFFIEDESLIPSHSLEDVFAELERLHNVKVRWLVVNAAILNVDHRPQDQFEMDAVKAIAAGKIQHDETADNEYRFAGRIRLSSQCLKCHVPNRTSTEDRAAGLVIRMPLRPAPSG
jgi:Protein of unknown function (DUF3365)